jgi:large-conductance mechanosensitive channel
MRFLYAALVMSTVVLVMLALVLFVRVRRLSRASDAQYKRLVSDEETAAKGDTHYQ